MAYFLLQCGHTRSLDEVAEHDIAELIAQPEMIPRLSWCEGCRRWGRVHELVPTSRPGIADDVPPEGALPGDAGTGGDVAVPGPRSEPSSVPAAGESFFGELGHELAGPTGKQVGE